MRIFLLTKKKTVEHVLSALFIDHYFVVISIMCSIILFQMEIFVSYIFRCPKACIVVSMLSLKCLHIACKLYFELARIDVSGIYNSFFLCAFIKVNVNLYQKKKRKDICLLTKHSEYIMSQTKKNKHSLYIIFNLYLFSFIH